MKKKRRVRVHHPETSAVVQGFDPELSLMAARPPIYPVSTYCFHNAAEAKRYFDIALGREGEHTEQDSELIYARLNNPNAEMFEEQLVPLERGAVEERDFVAAGHALGQRLGSWDP